MTLIKLFIGLILFGTLVALYVFNVPNCDHLKWLCESGLLGLGFFHMAGGQQEGIGVAGKQGGFARMGLLLSLALGCTLLTACATTPQTQVAYVQSCSAYNAAFGAAIVLRESGKLNQSQIDQVTMLDNQITPICTGALPTNPAQATSQITAAVTTLAILESTK